MKFNLNGKIIFSKDIDNEEVKAAIEEILKNSSELFLKGVPKGKEEEASKIVDYNICGKELFLNIVSGRYSRAHDAIIRLKKALAQKLGKDFKIGVRKVVVDKYIIEIEDNKIKNLKKLNVPECKSEILDNKIILIFENLEEGDLKRNIIDRAIKFVREELEKEDLTSKVCKIPPGTVVKEYKPSREFKFFEDPTDVAEKLGWVKKFPGRGQWIYLPPITSLLRAFEELLVEKIKKIGFVEVLLPKLIPLEVMYKMRYLEGLPEGMYYVSPPKREPELFEDFVNEMIIKKEIPIQKLKNLLRDPSYVLAPAQCEPFYQLFEKEVIDVDKPIMFFDRSGWTYRWEGGGARGLDRVNEFLRVECIWIGKPEVVEEIRDKTLKVGEELAEELDLEYWVEVGDDPFYLEGRKKEERDIEFPDVPKYEMRLALPYYIKKYNEKKGVAVTSANVHGTHFVEGFKIKDYKNRKVWTGCTGYGLTRWVVGYLSQYGFNFDDWHPIIKKKIKKLPEVPKLITWP
ncbi:serine--tRNA ligase [Methanocaldococcus indicus]|uniref:serine--tRNA ligase n=1 Tax=Methanocaldococcus indicus TaxID=213231 RepID=UPI003C6D108C